MWIDILTMENFVTCDVCQKSIPADSYESHAMGKKHRGQQELLAQRKNIVETGLFIRGIPLGVSAAEVGAAFGPYGPIAKVEVYGDTAYVNYMDVSSREKAMKYNHIIRHKVLEVYRRKIKSEPPDLDPRRSLKRDHDGSSLKFPPKNDRVKESPMTHQRQKQNASGVKKMIDNSEVLTAVAKTTSILEQISKLEELVLAGDDYCNDIQQQICNDLKNALKTAFEVSELYAFGSTTTGLAFKNSDLDVYALLELNPVTHQMSPDPKKIFATAKKCMYRRQHIFTNIVPIQEAKIPIIKVLHIPTQTSCDLSFHDAIGYCNSRLLRFYLNMHERFFDLIFFIKYWASVHKFNSPSGLSNFSLCMFGISFLMSLKDSLGNKLLPSVQELMKNADPSSPFFCVKGWKCGFDETPIAVPLPDTPEFSLAGLLKSFFEYIANLPFETHVVSVLTGELINRQVFEHNPHDLPDAYECYKSHIALHPNDVLCKADHFGVIHDPFRLNHNLIGRVNKTNMKKFILACQTAKKDCEEAINDSEKEVLLLPHLLSQSEVKMEESTPKRKTVSVIVEQPFITGAQDLEKIKNLLCSIFRRLLLLETTMSEEGNLEEFKPKICRVEGMKDVLSQSKDSDQHYVILNCKGQTNVWAGRRKAKMSINIKNPLSFQDEESISKFLSKPNSAASEVEFQCKVLAEKKILHLKFQNKSGTNLGNFNNFMSFVNQRLPKWISDFSKVKL